MGGFLIVNAPCWISSPLEPSPSEDGEFLPPTIPQQLACGTARNQLIDEGPKVPAPRTGHRPAEWTSSNHLAHDLLSLNVIPVDIVIGLGLPFGDGSLHEFLLRHIYGANEQGDLMPELALDGCSIGGVSVKRYFGARHSIVEDPVEL